MQFNFKVPPSPNLVAMYHSNGLKEVRNWGERENKVRFYLALSNKLLMFKKKKILLRKRPREKEYEICVS